jgi:ribosome biogenesis protein Tsr3
MLHFRKYLSIPGLLMIVGSIFSKIPDHRSKNITVSLPDALMSALAMFLLKYPSLLQFDEERSKEIIQTNLKNLYGIDTPPCDTQMRVIIDPVNPTELRPAFVSVLNKMQASGALKSYRYFDQYYIVTVDATGQYASNNIQCSECCVKTSKSGETSYYHQLLAAAIVHPDKKTVIPFAPEAIIKETDASKNDCELNASKRLLKQIKKEHPRLPILVVEDALYAKAPHIKLLNSLDYRYIIGVKEGDHAHLFKSVQETIKLNEDNELNTYNEDTKITHGFRFINNLPLNKSHKDVRVNFLEYWETDEAGECIFYATWVTDIPLTKNNVFKIMRAGRARWKVENEVFNTLKNQGYNFEHNYGHGELHLATIFAMIMMLAFLIDQVQESCCELFQQARNTFRTKVYLWHKMTALFLSYFILDWETFYLSIINDHKPSILEPDGNVKELFNSS